MMKKELLDPMGPIMSAIELAIKREYDVEVTTASLSIAPTKKEFYGDYTLVVFPLTKSLRQNPQAIADRLGKALITQNTDLFADYNVIQGFLNLSMTSSFWSSILDTVNSPTFYTWPAKDQKVLVEFSSPNTNKPLHLGHIRNILLGWSTSKVLEKVGHPIFRTQIINDRGIAICKSMLAWSLYGDGITPESSGQKGDHLVGDFYRKFELAFQEEYLNWQGSTEGEKAYQEGKKETESAEDFYKRTKNKYFNDHSVLGQSAKEMLLKWEAGDPETKALWSKMNGWVYEGFSRTYNELNVHFDDLYYESNTYLLGKNIIEKGLFNKAFYQESDGSVWVDLEDVGLDKKILLRSDGTSVYMTQDLGTAEQRHLDTGASKMIYVVADEQDYHFRALFEILKKLKVSYADGLYHLSYGMVDLPSGRMKSREGTVVDADDLILEVINEVKKNSADRTELDDLNEAEREQVYHKIGLAAIKFFMLKVNPKKRMIFDPSESVDIQGQTGPYIQNAYVRISSIKRKLNQDQSADYQGYYTIEPAEKDLLISLATFREQVELAAKEYDPSVIANFAYELAKKFHRFYHDVRILTAETAEAKSFRLNLSNVVAHQLAESMQLLGIEMPERM